MYWIILYIFFFFSSRRRHTRSLCDWSSDVCSSDLYLEFTGLNLTFEVREGIIKHSRDYQPGASPDLAEYLLDLRPPLESQLIDWVDEIAYNTADLDDAREAELLNFDLLRAEVPLFAQAYALADL